MSPQELQVQEKKELDSAEEKTEVGRYFMPYTDIHETGDGIEISMEMPGVARDQLDVELEKNVLTVTGKVDFGKYEGLEPVYTEYNVGHFSRSFTLSSAIDKEHITARLSDGVLALTLPKSKEAAARRIPVG